MKQQIIKKVIDHNAALLYLYNDNVIGYIERVSDEEQAAYFVIIKQMTEYVTGCCYEAIKAIENKLRRRYHNAIFVEGTVDDIPLPF